MDHDSIKQKIYEHADGDYLPAEDQSMVKEHLALCAGCAEELKVWKQLRSGLRAMDTPRREDSVSGTVLRRIERENRSRIPLPAAQIWATTLALAGLLIYSFIPYNGASAGASDEYYYASAGDLGMEGIFEGSSLEQADPAAAHSGLEGDI